MSNTKIISSTTTGHAMDTTPLLGGAGREAVARLGGNSAVLAGVLLQGCPKTASGDAPEAADPNWTTLLSGEAGDKATREIADLPDYVRLGAAATDPIVLEGVQ